jgi:hypothetical protein
MIYKLLSLTNRPQKGFAAAVLIAALLTLNTPSSVLSAARSSAANGTTQLTHAVNKLNYWMSGSGETEGWRRYLMMNELEAQTGLGSQADLHVLGKIQSRFHSDVPGLKHPVFQNVKNAIDNQIDRLAASRTADISSLLASAKSKFVRSSVATLEQQRDTAVSDLGSLKRYYRATMSSRSRSEIFFDLQLDPMIEFLNDIDLKIAPEVSVGKIDSMIKDVKKEIDAVETRLDALPIGPEPDDEEDQLKLNSPSEDKDDATGNLGEIIPAEILIDNRPQEDNEKESADQLRQKIQLLEDKVDALNAQRKTVLKADRPRLTQRAKDARQLLKFERNFENLINGHGDPYFVTAATSLETFSRAFFFGTSGNLQEDFLKQLLVLEKQIPRLGTDDHRDAAGITGATLRWLEQAGQTPELITAIRSRYSLPNFYLTVSSSLINRLAGQTLNDRQRIRQQMGGRLVRGRATTNAAVSIEFVDDPNQIQANLRLNGTVQSGSYVQQGKIQVFTRADGNIAAVRRVFANVGGVHADPPEVDAAFSASYVGTSSSLGLVDRIARKQFEKARGGAERFAENDAKEKLIEQFGNQSNEPIKNGNQRLAELRKKTLEKSDVLPSAHLRSLHNGIQVIAKKETLRTLAANTTPVALSVQPEIAVRMHDTIVSNFLNKTFSGKVFTSDELAGEIAELTGEIPPGLSGANEDGEEAESFTIYFSRIRPIELQFVNQTFRVVVSARDFAQGGNKIGEGLKIVLTFKIISQDGVLKLQRDGNVELEYLDKKRTPKLVAFRSFLDERLNSQAVTDEEPTALPANLLPIEQVPALQDSPIAKQLRLVQFRCENGWLYLGWNQEATPGASINWIYDLPGIWR